jgi:thiosulfate dehydrogenase
MSNSMYFLVGGLLIAALITGVFVVLTKVQNLRRTVLTQSDLPTLYKRELLGLQRMHVVVLCCTLVLAIGGIGAWLVSQSRQKKQIATLRAQLTPVFDKTKIWESPDPQLAETDAQATLIAYGADLIRNTQDYFGENGLVRPASINGLNCQNCHLEAGSKPFGNNYFAVASTYPQLRARSGALETIPKRVNDCFLRSLNGTPIDTNSYEMRAILAYMQWLGTGIPKGEKPKGSGLVEVPMLDRAAEPEKGRLVYAAKCASCHGPDGQGLPILEGPRSYPPLWGPRSYNAGAGLFRMSRLAGYVKANMPFGASYQNPQLSDAEAWDVAAFINAQERPVHPFLSTDWPNIAKKPFDHPFGPYKDTFPEIQHKFGPFGPIVAYYKTLNSK